MRPYLIDTIDDARWLEGHKPWEPRRTAPVRES